MEKIDNLVLFPSSKNYRPAPGLEEIDLDQVLEQAEATLSESAIVSDDPLEALLREGSDMPSFDEDDEEFDQQQHINLLIEQYQHMIASSAQLAGAMAQARRLQILSAIQQRISYYIGELERYLPGRGMH